MNHLKIITKSYTGELISFDKKSIGVRLYHQCHSFISQVGAITLIFLNVKKKCHYFSLMKTNIRLFVDPEFFRRFFRNIFLPIRYVSAHKTRKLCKVFHTLPQQNNFWLKQEKKRQFLLYWLAEKFLGFVTRNYLARMSRSKNTRFWGSKHACLGVKFGFISLLYSSIRDSLSYGS